MTDAGYPVTGPHPTLDDLLDPSPSPDDSLVEKIAAMCEQNRKLLEALEQGNEKADVVQTRVREQTDRASVQAQALQHLLQIQSQESEERTKERAERVKNYKLRNRLLGVGLTVFTVGGGILLSYFKTQSESQGQKQSSDIVRSVEAEMTEMERRVDTTEKKIERLGEIAIEQQVQLADSIEYIGDKIDAAHPRQADDVEPPPSVKRAKKKSESIKMRRGVEKLFNHEDDPTNPFAGLQGDK